MPIHHTALGAVAAGILALSLAGCDNRNNNATPTTGSAPATTPSAPVAVTPPTPSTPASSTVGNSTTTGGSDTTGASLGSVVANTAQDATITTKVNAAFANDSELSAMKIDVDTKNGAVTLTGPAPSAAAKDRASTMARAIDGVTTVNNNLTVKAS
jgi:hyperosmotically inducible protein